jgi:thiosulfate reductase cytochrome b subunit
MKKVYLYKGFERFWHWGQTLLVLTLMITGFEIHSSYNLLGYETAVIWHNYAAWAFIVLIIFAFFWHISTDQWRNYVPTRKNLKAQIEYYVTGIFKNAPHPTRKRTLSKLNPLQRIIYLGLIIIVLPVMVISGLFYMFFNYPTSGFEIASLQPIAVVHTLGAFLLIAFLIAHLYLITTGRTVFSNLKAMITGWEEMDDEEVKEIVEEAIENTGKIIISAKGDKSSKQVKDVVIEALEETEKKVKEDKLDGQKNKSNNKK